MGLASNANTQIDTINSSNHSFLEIFQSFLMKKTIKPIVRNNSINEKDVSWKKCNNPSQFHHGNKHTGVNSIGRIDALTHIIHSVLKILDQTKLATHISYFFLIIAVIVVASSGRLVHAAIIVAQIAHSDIHNVWAMKTAASTITSDAITNNQILAISFVIFSNIHFEVSFAQGILLLNAIITNIKNNRATNISLTLSIPNIIRNTSFEVLILMNASRATHKNKYKKFLILGTETSILSSVGDSFLIIR